jgi:hypothetical protein
MAHEGLDGKASYLKVLDEDKCHLHTSAALMCEKVLSTDW